MVHEKKRSGDPDYDDKVPMADQLGETATAPDGTVARLTESNGPIGPDGAHVNLEPVADTDNRPAPGSVATEVSETQTATPPAESAAAKDKASTPAATPPADDSTKGKPAPKSPAK